MTAPPPLFDRALRRARRDRGFRLGPEDGLDGAEYLHQAAADGFADRLSLTPRAYPDAAIVAAGPRPYRALARDAFGVERLTLVEAAPALAARLRAEARAGETVIEADAETPGLEAGRFDLVLFGLDLHAVNDPVGALIQARRAMKPDSLLLAAVFGGASLIELRAALAEAEAETLGGLSPRVAPMAEVRDWGGLLQRAGFALPVADSDRLTLWHPSPLALMRELRAMGETNTLAARSRRPMRRAMLARTLERLAAGARADGKTPTTVEIVTLTGWSPGASQPQPLRPGSARARLADALGAEERPAGERAAPPPREKP